MQPVSQLWKNAHRETLLPESYVEIALKVGDPNAQHDATVEENGAEFFSEPQEIVDQTVEAVKYAMLEPGLWILDGTYRLVGGSLEPPEVDYLGFVPAGTDETMQTAGGQDFYVLSDF